jgi:hypothetical protein
MAAAAGTGATLLGSVSLKPSPGREGMTTWNDCSSPGGLVRGDARWARLRPVKGKGGRRSSGTAAGLGERKCRKWMRSGASAAGMAIAVRNWGRSLRLRSTSRHEYLSTL